MADYKDPWAWMQGEQVPKMQNVIPQMPQTQAPANVGGPSGPGIIGTIALNRGTNAGIDYADKSVSAAMEAAKVAPQEEALNAKWDEAIKAIKPPTSAPLSEPTTNGEIVNSATRSMAPKPTPTTPVSAAPVEPTTQAAVEGTKLATQATEATATDASAIATALQTAGLTQAQIDALLLAQQSAMATGTAAGTEGAGAYLSSLFLA